MVNELNKEYTTMQLPDRLPFSYQPDEIIQHSQYGMLNENDAIDDVIDTRFYLTRCSNDEDYKDANILPELQKNLKLGRPDLDKIFIEVKD